MWEAIGPLLGMLLALAAQILLMRWFWRRMKKVQRSSPPKPSRIPPMQRWRESVGPDGEQRVSDVNDDLLKLGAMARQSRWPIDNQ